LLDIGLISAVIFSRRLDCLSMHKNRRKWICFGPMLPFVLPIFLMVSSCQEKTKVVDAFPDTSPTAEQLASSPLCQFVRTLGTLPEGERDSVARQFVRNHPATPLVESDRLAGFFWYGKATNVSLNGDLQHGWTMPEPLERIACGESSFFFRVYQAPPDARLDYVLSVDGKETTDPRNPRVSPSYFAPHSELAMPQFKPSLARQLRQDVEHGTMEAMLFNSTNALVKPRTVKLYRPAGHDQAAKLPCLYVYDGIEALEYMSYTNVLDNLVADRRIKPLIVVFIEMAKEDMQLFPGRFNLLAEAVCGELVPRIDGASHSSALPSDRAITGISVWGNLALTTAFTHPGVFSQAAGQSTTINEQLIEVAGRFAGRGRDRAPLKIYLDVGNYDLGQGALNNHSFLRANELFVRELDHWNIPYIYRVYNDGHQWANWRERTDAILGYFFPIAGS